MTEHDETEHDWWNDDLPNHRARGSSIHLDDLLDIAGSIFDGIVTAIHWTGIALAVIGMLVCTAILVGIGAFIAYVFAMVFSHHDHTVSLIATIAGGWIGLVFAAFAGWNASLDFQARDNLAHMGPIHHDN